MNFFIDSSLSCHFILSIYYKISTISVMYMLYNMWLYIIICICYTIINDSINIFWRYEIEFEDESITGCHARAMTWCLRLTCLTTLRIFVYYVIIVRHTNQFEKSPFSQIKQNARVNFWHNVLIIENLRSSNKDQSIGYSFARYSFRLILMTVSCH